MKRSRQRIEVNLPELDAVLDRALHEPLSDPDYQKLKTALHALAGLATPERNTEKTESVLAEFTGTLPQKKSQRTRNQHASLAMAGTARMLSPAQKRSRCGMPN